MKPDTAATRHANVSEVTGIEERSLRQKLLTSQPFWVTVALLVLAVGIALYQPSFASAANLSNVTRNFAPFGIMALGMTCVIITGGIDLSVGSIMGLVAIVAGLALTNEYSWQVAFSLGLLAGLHDGVGWPHQLVQALAVLVVAAFLFVAMRGFVFAGGATR